MRAASSGSRLLAAGLLAATLAGVSGCGNWSDVGKLPVAGPTATPATVGEPFSIDASGNIHATVRAGANVVLSGTDSVKGSTPILGWQWTQTNASPAVTLIERNTAVYSFRAPQVAASTDLSFQLTVIDANGNKASRMATVTVEPVQDANQFLLYPAPVVVPPSTTYQVVAIAGAATVAAAAADATQTLGSFKITVSRYVHYMTQGTPQTRNLQVGTPIAIEGSWPAALGVSTDPTDPRNPHYQLNTPNLNADDVNSTALVQGGTLANGTVTAGDQTQRLELSTINEASVTLCATIDALSGSVAPALGFLDNLGKPVTPTTPVSVCPAGSFEMPAASLVQRVGASLDTLASAKAYYATVDPNNARTTFSNWLKTNGWQAAAGVPDVTNDCTKLMDACAHAVYTNNFDLGLGRDMYAKVGACDTAGQLNVGACDVSSVVINYQGIEAAAHKTGPIIAVAMEYRRPDGVTSGDRIVTFFAYAPNPDDPNGDFAQVYSANLDTRGERYLPGGCTVCHGGAAAPVIDTASGPRYGHGPQATVNGDLNAGFLAWDLKSFLYADTDLSWTKVEDATLRQQLTQASQAAQFKRLSTTSYLTYKDPAASPYRFLLVRQLVTGWYGGAATLPAASLDAVLPANAFNASYVPPDWASANNGNPADGTATLGSGDVYLQIFAQHCRACHAIQVPLPDVAPTDAKYCSGAASARLPIENGENPQQAYGCYWSFVHDTLLPGYLGSGGMPVARRTTDRMWVSTTAGAASPGAKLLTHLASVPGLAGAVPPPPGQKVIARPSGPNFYAYKLDGSHDPTPSVTPDVTQVVQYQANASFAAGYNSGIPGYAWSVKRCTSAGVASSCTEPVAVSGSNSAIAAFRLAAPADYRATLTLTGLDGVADAPIDLPLVSVKDTPPAFVAPPSALQLSVSSALPLIGGAGLYLNDLDHLGIAWGNGGPAQARVKLALCVPAAGTSCNSASDSYVDLTPPCTLAGCTALDLATASLTLQSGVIASPVGGSKLEVTVYDAAQNTPAVQDFPVTVTSLETPTPIQEQIGANAVQTTFCLSSMLPPPPANTAFEIVLSSSAAQLSAADLSTLSYPVVGTIPAAIVGHGGSATVVPCGGSRYNLGVAYTPPAGLSTANSAGVAFANASPDTFYYSIVIHALPAGGIEQVTGAAPIAFTITQRNSFQDVANLLNLPYVQGGQNCVGCHAVGPPVHNYDHTPIVDFTVTTAADQAALCALLANGGTQTLAGTSYTFPVDHSPFADITDVLHPTTPNSGLLCLASGSCKDPDGGGMPFNANLSDLAPIATWIEDGKNCP